MNALQTLINTRLTSQMQTVIPKISVKNRALFRAKSGKLVTPSKELHGIGFRNSDS